MSWVFRQEDPGLADEVWWEVGFYEPDGDFMHIYECPSKSEASELVHYLNGGSAEQISATFSSPIEVQGQSFTTINTEDGTALGVEVRGSIETQTQIDP